MNKLNTSAKQYPSLVVIFFAACILALVPVRVGADSQNPIQVAGFFEDLGKGIKDLGDIIKGGKEVYEEGKELKETVSNGEESEPTTPAEWSETVRETQQRLSNLGFNPGPIDGFYGAQTQKAILSFQQIRGLPPDGNVSGNLLVELRAVDNTPYQPGGGVAAQWPNTQSSGGNWPSTQQSGGNWPSTQQSEGNWPSTQQSGGSWPSNQQSGGNGTSNQQSGENWPSTQQSGGNWPSIQQSGEGANTSQSGGTQNWPSAQPSDSDTATEQTQGDLVAPAIGGAAPAPGSSFPQPSTEGYGAGGLGTEQSPSASPESSSQGSLISPSIGGGLVAQPPGGGVVAQPPSAASPTDGSSTATTPVSGGGTPTPVNMKALAQQYDLRLIQGRPVIGEGSTKNEVESLQHFFTLLAIRLNADALSGENSSGNALNTIQLCLANKFLSPVQKDQVLAGKAGVAIGSTLSWKGTGQNEFEAGRAKEKFVNEFLPQIIANTPTLPLEFVYIVRSRVQKYDHQKRGFSLGNSSNLGSAYSASTNFSISRTSLTLPQPFCQLSIAHLPISPLLPNFWALGPNAAEQALKYIPTQQSSAYGDLQREVFYATIFTFSAAPTAKTDSQSAQQIQAIPLTVSIKAVGLFQDPDLERNFYTFALEAPPAPSVLLSGIPESIPTPPRMILDGEAATLLLLRDQGDVLDEKTWESLARRHLHNDQQYYAKKATKVINGAHYTINRDSFDPNYIPFAPNGFKAGGGGGQLLTEKQMEIFKAWSLKRAAALPQRFELHSSLIRDQKTGEYLISLTGMGSSNQVGGQKKALATLTERGYVPGQIVRLNLSSIQSSSGLVAGHAPILMLPNLVKNYQPSFSEEQLRQALGIGKQTGIGRFQIHMELLIAKTEVLPLDAQNKGFIIFGRPVSVEVPNKKGTRIVLKETYQEVAALDPNQTSTGSLDVSQTGQKKMPFSAEVTDLLVAKFLPEALDKPAIERMMLARWHYESSFNGKTQEPEWGRFYIEGKPKPGAQQRTELAPRFRDWTLKRAQAMSNVVTFVIPHVLIRQPGPIELSSHLSSNQQTSPADIAWRCRSIAGSTQINKPTLAESHDRACEFLRQAAAIPGQEIYIGRAGDLSAEARQRRLQNLSGGLSGIGVGPRLNCGQAIYGQDKYCTAMLNELRGDLLGQPFALDDVLIIDKEVVIPSDQPKITQKKGVKGVELDVEIAGIRRTVNLPRPKFLKSYREYESFIQKAGLRSEGGQWTSKFDQETVPLFLIYARVLEARVVENSKGQPQLIAKLPLQKPSAPDKNLLKVIDPERILAPEEPFGPDVVGVRLGMSFETADEIIRQHMDVGRVLEADRAWQTKAATGVIQPYTSGRLYESKDANESIIVFDEPPSAPRVVLGLVRQVSFDKGTLPPAAVFAKIEKKYGKASGPDPSGAGRLWFGGVVVKDYSCSPSYNAVSPYNIWRDPNNSSSDQGAVTQASVDHTPDDKQDTNTSPDDHNSAIKGYEEQMADVQAMVQSQKQQMADMQAMVQSQKLASQGMSRRISTLDCRRCDHERISMAKCPTGLAATFDTQSSNEGDQLVIRLFDNRIYAQQFTQSKHLFEQGNGVISTGGTQLDLKL